MTDIPIPEDHPIIPQDLDIQNILEALLFVAPGPVTPQHISQVLELPVREVEAGLNDLETEYLRRGLRLLRHQGRVQVTTAPEAASLIERFLGLEASSRLSRAALETLSIIAYQQPTTRPEIDSIRGVNSDGVLKSLLSKGLIQETGRAEKPGRPILYATTSDFLQHFGIRSLGELPLLSKDETAYNGSAEEAPLKT
jgi:segregation and condensation protein B